MDDGRIIAEGERLSQELSGQRRTRDGHRWRCAVELRSRVVAYAVTCSADGESHQRIADRLGLKQRTLSRWIRTARQTRAGVRQVAIVPSTQERTTPPPARAALRLVTPRGFVVEGLDAELLVSLLQVLG